MGAVATNRKRTQQSFNHQSPSSKKPRFSLTMSNDSSKPSSKLSRYPDAKIPLKRQVHAPSRGTFRFGSMGRSKPDAFDKNYEYTKRTALDSLRIVRKEKAFVDLSHGFDKEEIFNDIAMRKEKAFVDLSDGFDKEEIFNDIALKHVRKEETFVDLGDDDSSVEIVECDKEEKKSVEPCSSSGVTEVVKSGNELRVEDASVMLDSLCLGLEKGEGGGLGLEAYKKLQRSAEKRDSKLEALGFEILYHEKRKSHLIQSRPKPVEKPKKVPQEPFIPLTEEDEDEVYSALSGRNRRKVLVTHESSNIDITGEVLQCLQPSAWLNDEVINVYLELLKERETREPKKYLKCHFFNTFFYKKLVSDSGYNYKAVRRWTTQRKLGYALIDCDMIFVPIHRGVHWTLAVINIRDQKFLYLDSLNGADPMILNALAKYLGDEVKEKSGKYIDVSSWVMECVEDPPQQQNGYDCGMFMLKYIDFFSRGLGLCFSQEHMQYFRQRTAKEILRLRAD